MKHINKFLVLLLCLAWQNVNANTFILPPEGQSLIGQIEFTNIGSDTTLSDQARKYSVGFHEIRQANPEVNAWLPADDTTLLIPTQYILPDTDQKGIVINVPEMRLYYFHKVSDGEKPRVTTYPISIGRGDWETPLGEAHITQKKANPTWTPPESIKKEHLEAGDPLPDVVPAGPDNPLGQYALRLSIPGYLIHGTNKPYGIGMRVTHGCIRLYPENIEEIFDYVDVGTQVKLIHQPYKFGQHLDWVYMEANPLLQPDDTYELDMAALIQAVVEYNEKLPAGWRIDVEHAKRIAKEASGIPTRVNIIKSQSKQAKRKSKIPQA